MLRPRRAWRTATAALIIGGLAASAIASPTAAGPVNPADQQYRPLYHFTPKKNWMNDPNGMVYVDGTYHLFYQHNPYGTTWGNMSWGHATSTDLLTWKEQPIAIPQTLNDDGRSIEDIFSGSIVIDTHNSAGFKKSRKGPAPLVAVYTSAYTDQHPTLAGRQAQSLAYSLDNGKTWTKYAYNPVLDRSSANFRDPKVFWYEGKKGSYWVMVAVEATEHKVVIYKSNNLKDWTHLSDFGPANSTAGIWECPDLFELAVDGNPRKTKWVMVVNLNPGAVGGGSGGQYFVGNFDGTTFTSESTVTSHALPQGTVFDDFEGGYDKWTVANEPGNWKNGPWGDAPAQGTLPDQSPVSGFEGNGLVNGFLDHDWPIGTMTSDEFTISSPHINFLVGGGRHPWVEGAQLGNEAPAGAEVLFDFEQGQPITGQGWTVSGDFTADRNPSNAGGDYYKGEWRINTWEGGPKGDDNVGTLTSPSFTIDKDYVSMLVGGGKRTDGSLAAQLVVDGQVVRTATGQNDGALNWQAWDVADLKGKSAQLRINDQATGGWGHLTLDHVVQADEPAQVRSGATAINLVVDGEVVRSATGNNSETLNWASWDVSDLRGKKAELQIVDNNRAGWGHILVDHIMFGDQEARSRLEAYDWLDWGRDYYATVSYSNVGGVKGRVMQGWMNNWDYAQDIPTSTWRSSMTLPRTVKLVSTPKGPRLQQSVIGQLDTRLDKRKARSVKGKTLRSGTTPLGLSGDVVKLDVVLRPGSADTLGLRVYGNREHGTLIGYDATSGRLFIDRTNSGTTDFAANFASVQELPVTKKVTKPGKKSTHKRGHKATKTSTVAFTVYLDRASVELFTADGLGTMTDQVFPDKGATRIDGFATGGKGEIVSLKVTPVKPTMWKK
ncbi:MAG: GH32 C-terminal domain-containing protein [Tessaracoccus sp.]|uniref:glycoside hydrolase family 32 protein n=1 Tax=Tessaracoccus sp. TaxID=1971211 RepID=UPI001ECA1710|nr:glycoside hydrolase family 32 protein [Tessaracoccus sp.]MBK7820017.1 GH32 C-terminal domain-containing protein [Tessaracoccus sp.]